LETIQQFWNWLAQNWPSAAITLVVAIASYLTTRETLRRLVSSAQKEKIHRATERVMALIEFSFIRRRQPSVEDVEMWKRASARESGLEGANRLPSYSQLLDDLDFRMMQSSLLTTEQKEEYRVRILEAISELREERREEVAPAAMELITELRDYLETDNKDKALSTLQDLTQSIATTMVSREELLRLQSRWQRVLSLVVAVIASAVMSLIIRTVFEIIRG